MTSLNTTLSLAQMMVRAQHRHEHRLAHGGSRAGTVPAPRAEVPAPRPAGAVPDRGPDPEAAQRPPSAARSAQRSLASWALRAAASVASRR